jgi:hypothetical protein
MSAATEQKPRLDQFTNPNMPRPEQAVQRFDPDAWHVMQQRDNALIEQEILNGAGSSKFVYSFQNQGETVSGISVIGARHLAAHYGGIKHRLIGSVTKTGKQMLFMTYPQPGMPMSMHCTILPELEKEPDFYTVLGEITDLKTGNVVQVETTEMRMGKRRDGTPYVREHYRTIAQSKMFRNGVLDIIPQDVKIEWQQKMLALGKSDIITRDVLSEKRAGVMRYAAKIGLPINRQALETLMLEQIQGLVDAAAEEKLEGFRNSATSLRILEFNKPSGNGAWGNIWPSEREETSETGAAQPTKAKAPQNAKAKPEPQEERREERGRPVTIPLISADGEVLLDAGHSLEWAKEFARHLEEVPADMLQAYEEFNADAIQAALADPEARAVLLAVGVTGAAPAAQGKAQETVDPASLIVQNPGGRLSEDQTVQVWADALAQVHDEEVMKKWREANFPAINSFPTKIKLRILREIAGRCRTLGIEIPQ